MPIQQFPPPHPLPVADNAQAIEPLLMAAARAMQDNNPVIALAHFRAVLQFCRTSFLRGEQIEGDIEKISWQMLHLAINARHFPMAAAMARHLYLVADNSHQKFDAGCNWLQLLVKLKRGRQAKKLAAHLLQHLLPTNDLYPRHWVNIQLADLAMQEEDNQTAITLLQQVEKHLGDLNQFDRNNFWRINSFAHLQAGDYQRGFHFYEHRGDMADPAFPYFPPNPLHEKGKEWHGQATDVLLISAEQGLGDVLQFVRFLPAITPFAKKILLEVQAPLIPLLQQSPTCRGITITQMGYIPTARIDHWCFLNSLPFLLQEKITPPRDAVAMQQFYQPPQPYLAIDRNPLPPLPATGKKYKIGLVWATSVGGPTGVARTMGLTSILPLLTDKKIASVVDFYGLQLGPAQKEIIGAGLQSAMHDLSPYLHDFAVTAAIVKQLDLVITVDTAMVHVAGGLGKKTFVLIPYIHDWRWGKKMLNNWHGIKNAKTSFWYPTTHAVFCQEKMDDWQEPVSTIRACLIDFLTTHC